MFQYDIIDAREMRTKYDKEKTYLTFLANCGLNPEEYPYEVENETFWKGKPNHFHATSWGGYMAENGWTVYITYRTTHANHCRMHSWKWDSENNEPVSHSITEFIGG